MAVSNGFRHKSQFGDGNEDGLEPVYPIDLSGISSFSDLLEAYKDTAFGARALGEAADVLTMMVSDPDCHVVMTLSGAMTVAKMGLVICDMIDHGMVDAIVSTGALMCHGLVEASGLTHFKYRPGMKDAELYERGYDRVYDTLELEKNLGSVARIIEGLLAEMPAHEPLCSHVFCHELGHYLAEQYPDQRGILKSAFEKEVPIYVPAWTDSEIGLDVGVVNRRRRHAGEQRFTFDPYLDLEHFTDTLIRQQRLGIFTIGGGVPRNWAQQFGPYIDEIAKYLNISLPAPLRYRYCVRICPEPVHWGGLSGCTYSEGVSWGKFIPREEGGRWAEVMADATIAWPLLVKAVMERLKL
jgi:deoxyhypusine synthase